MVVTAIKTGLVFIVMLTILGIVQTQSIVQTGMLFLAAGLFPGINVELSAELTLVAAAGILLVALGWACGRYAVYQAEIKYWLPRYRRVDAIQDPPFADLVPGIKGLRTARQVVVDRTAETLTTAYFLLKHFGRPTAGQTVAVRNGGALTRVRFDRWAQLRVLVQDNLLAAETLLRAWAHKAKEYFDRFIVS